jgi:hypothetical protein
MNYGCMGSFNLLDGNDSDKLRCEYLMGMAVFANTKDKLAILKDMLNKFKVEFNNYTDKLDVIDRTLRNPFQNPSLAA